MDARGVVFVICVAESEYPCGNIFGIYLSREAAEVAMVAQRKVFEDCHEAIDSRCASAKSMDGPLHDLTELRIIEVPVNVWLLGSATGCAGCMSIFDNSLTMGKADTHAVRRDSADSDE